MDASSAPSLQLPSERVAIGQVFAVEIAGQDFVAWRGADGVVRSAPRWCPHLDHDLADGYVLGNELVCAGHAWAFDGAGNAFKRNELGRVDPKGRVRALAASERDTTITLSLRGSTAPA